MTSSAGGAAPLDLVVVGAGFTGVYAVIQAKRTGRSVVCLEAGEGVGGVWYWNRYPGARCDVESADYSYSFDEELQQEWQWSERFATQPEILAYIEHVAERHEVYRHIRFGQRVAAAVFNDETNLWTVTTEAGDTFRARFVLFATGPLSVPSRPDFPGLASFAGELVLTAEWPSDGLDVRGKRVGVIGTGSSGIQCIPILAADAAELTVFQRTPNYSVPVGNRALDAHEWAEIKRGYADRRRQAWGSKSGLPHEPYPKSFHEIDDDEREQVFAAQWSRGGVLFASTFTDQSSDPTINAAARDFVVRRIRSLIDDPEVAQRLIPRDYPLGAKRICTDNGYFETFNREHVRLISVLENPILEIVSEGVQLAEELVELDVLVLATGFDAMTGALNRIRIEGPHGELMTQTWEAGPITQLGLAVPGFPNLFVLAGPGSPSVLTNMVLAGEQHVNWVLELIDHLDAHGYGSVEARRDAAEEWTAHVDSLADKTVHKKANSWHLGANIPGKPRIYMPYLGGFANYIRRCEESRDAGYSGFVLSS